MNLVINESIQVAGIYREAWLTELALRIKERGLLEHYQPDPFKVTCGWPSKKALGKGSRVVGECFAPEVSKAGLCELFISPLLADPLEVAGTLMHEMCHVIASVKAKHGKVFKEVCDTIGLTQGKPATVMPGNLLNNKLLTLIHELPDYPHKALEPTQRQVKPRGSNSLVCPGCGCKITMSSKWVEQSGYPTCGCGLPFEPGEGGE